ncbi:hypothetical protein BGZ49_009569 [Haplosporangium sp. Z 27]|nr:hypothetical protein BGZ49_009569 [Haplosporangium sp. Z 27]
MSSTPPTGSDESTTTLEVLLTLPKATIYQLTSPTSESKLIGTGDLRVYASAQEEDLPSSSSQSNISSSAPPATFLTLLENNDKSLITHPLMPRSSAQKVSEKTWRFTVPGNGYLELQLPEASEKQISELENILTDRIIYTNQHKLRNQLAIVDDVGQIYGVLDEEGVEVHDDDNVSLSENQKSPVVVHAIEPDEEQEDKPLKLKISVPSSDDLADYITSASQTIGDQMVRGATFVAGGIATSGAYLNSKFPETKKPLVISPFIKNRIRNVTKVSRATLSITSRFKTALISKAFNTGYRALKYWTAKDDPESYSTMQNLCYSVLNSAGILIQATEQSVGIITAPAINATQEFAGRTLGPDAKEIVGEALEGFKNFYLVYFDNAGVSRRAFLQTSRLAALQTAQEVKEGKLKMKERKKNPSDHVQGTLPLSDIASSAAASAGAAATQVKELIFKYVGKTDDNETASSSAKASSSEAEALDEKKTK